VYFKDLIEFHKAIKLRVTLEVTELRVRRDLTASLQVMIQGPNLLVNLIKRELDNARMRQKGSL
jgi:hypothetical protein